MESSEGGVETTQVDMKDESRDDDISANDTDLRSQEDGYYQSPETTDLEFTIRDLQQQAPPLPPRPSLAPNSRAGSLRLSRRSSRPQLLSQPTIALSLTDAHSQSHADAASLQSSPASRNISRRHSPIRYERLTGTSNSDTNEPASPRSISPTPDARVGADEIKGAEQEETSSLLSLVPPSGVEAANGTFFHYDECLEAQFIDEFKSPSAANDENYIGVSPLEGWKSKLKHFFIISASGKPIYSRHGDDQLISHYIGVAQTLIASYQDSGDSLKGFSAGNSRFVILSKGHLNLIAISRLGESDAQLRMQLESLYTQILSTLTLPSMEKMFSLRPSTDLRRPLHGTEVLLDGLADGFTRGSLSTLLSALECLRLRKTDRKMINDALLAARSPDLLYGLIITRGRLVSVLRPKKHSLHPGDLHLIHNMLFGAGSIESAGGENWIPLCLPGFNNTGFVYMYVSFLPDSTLSKDNENTSSQGEHSQNDLVIVFISASKEAFYSLRNMRDAFISSLRKTNTLSKLYSAIQKPRPSCNELFPDKILKHFLYKSRGNVQFVMPSFAPYFTDVVARRKLISLYEQLHENIHTRYNHLKVQHMESSVATAVAWETPLFELYCIAGPQVPRTTIAQAANRVVQWVRREEDRLFIIGGAVF